MRYQIKNLSLGSIALFILMLIACGRHAALNKDEFAKATTDSVRQLAVSIATDVSREGPIAWLRYFKNSPDFFMASEGRLAFSNYNSAAAFIKNILVKKISNIQLQWNNIRIVPLAPGLASFSADFHEKISDSAGNKTSTDGYFSSVAQSTPEGWKFYNAHWPINSKKE
jgi:hypothetical protein